MKTKDNTGSRSSAATITPQQKQFIVGLEQLELARKFPDLYNKSDTEKIVMDLWESICAFAQSTTKSMIQSFVSNPEKDDDYQQNLFLAFFEQLTNYNPYKSSPTTFFAPYFRCKARNHIRSLTNLSDHYAQNMSKYISAVRSFETMNIIPTVEMLSEKTGLSEKVIKSLREIHTYQRVSVELAATHPSQESTPEQICVSRETISNLINVIKNNLSPYEQKIFLCYLNFYMRLKGNEKRTYEEVANMLNSSIKSVKNVCRSCVKKLRDCKEFRLLNM